MGQVIVDAVTRAKLIGASGRVEVRDEFVRREARRAMLTMELLRTMELMGRVGQCGRSAVAESGR